MTFVLTDGFVNCNAPFSAFALWFLVFDYESGKRASSALTRLLARIVRARASCAPRGFPDS
jgi:hypothetical protein